jgi:hypothetical protein
LYQGHASALELVAYDGRRLMVGVPDNSFLQLSDNREWNWSIFQWHCFVPVAPDRSELLFEIKDTMPAGTVPVRPLVDKFGQSTREEWPDKVKGDADLEADLAVEKQWYESLKPPVLDEYGGLPGSREKLGLKATGFFHVQKVGERWILVNPAGNAFFHLAPCVVNPNDDYTLVKGREAAYEWLPKPEGEFASVFRPESQGEILSFHLVNQIRKYGEPWDNERYTARMIARLKKWGFNSIGAFSSGGEKARQEAKFPTVAHLPLNLWEGVPRIPGIHETFDPFDEKTRAVVEANMARELPPKASDPLIIGYFIVNEPIYEQIPHVVPSLKASQHACKRRMVQWLSDKYRAVGPFNAAWGLQVGDFADLGEMGIPVSTDAAKADAEAFATFFLDEYLTLVKTAFRKHDPNHLLIGSRLQPGTIRHEWICRTLGRHLDVMSYNYYTYDLDKEELAKIYQWTGGLPMMLSEFFWSSPTDSGLDGGREVGSQQERGLMYRNYVEQAAALGFVVGVEWFTLVDQSVTGRWFSGFDGERSNSGLISVTDRPWKPVLEEMMKTNYDIYRVWLGEREPFAYQVRR